VKDDRIHNVVLSSKHDAWQRGCAKHEVPSFWLEVCCGATVSPLDGWIESLIPSVEKMGRRRRVDRVIPNPVFMSKQKITCSIGASMRPKRSCQVWIISTAATKRIQRRKNVAPEGRCNLLQESVLSLDLLYNISPYPFDDDEDPRKKNEFNSCR